MPITKQRVALIPDNALLGSTLHLRVMDCSISIHCQAEPRTCLALHTAFAGLQSALHSPVLANWEYTVHESGRGLELAIDARTEAALDLGDLLYLLDKQITLALQGVRKDLIFIHGGAVTTPDGRVIVLTAASGSGKSTLTWALLHHGFGYLSDELAPIDPQSLTVQGYPHAVCLKRQPPHPYALPPETLMTSRSLHVPVAGMGASGRLAAILFVDHRRPEQDPVLTPIGAARAALHLYTNTLNPLAHPNDGLDAVAAITQNVACYEVNSANLATACAAIAALNE